MKKYNLYLWLFALIGIITSCSQDENLPQSADNNLVSLSAGIDRGAQTRANIPFVTIKPGYKLRYVLEVWDTKTPSNLVHRNETTAMSASAVNFDFKLTTAGNYKALLWADFVSDNATESSETTPNAYTHYADCYYKTTDNLKTITLAKSGTDYTINAQPRDAYFACADIKKESGAFSKSVQLTRPFGHINIIEKDNSLLAKVTLLTATYHVPKGFDVSTGQPAGTTVEVKPTVTQLATPEKNGAQANLFSDYIFAPQDNQTTLGEIKLTFISSEALLLDDFTIPANMPVKRNKRTNISGSILHLHTSTVPSDVAELSVSVNDMWSGTSEDVDVATWDGNYPTSEAEAKEWLGTESAGATDADGRNHVFTITTARQLAALHYLIITYNATMTNTTSNEYYSYATCKLAADIDLNNHPWIPIGIAINSMNDFRGIFDGQGHTIRGLINTDNRGFGSSGFFGIVTGVVKHLNVKGRISPNYTGSDAYYGGIAGRMLGTVAFCSFEGTITSTSPNPIFAGGIAGLLGSSASPGQILSCYSVVTDMTLSGTGSHSKGGIVGKMSNEASVIKGCYWHRLTGIIEAYGAKSGNGTVEKFGSFADAAGANDVVVNVMNTATPTGYDDKWQVGTNGGYPVLVPNSAN